MSQVLRRRFLLIAGALLAAPLAAAQSVGKIHRVACLGLNPQPASGPFLYGVLKDALREFGYVEGRNLLFEYRHADGKPERLQAVATKLARSNPDVIVTAVNAMTHAAKQATRTIPIVMIVGTDVVEEGLVASLARPGGNITGLTWDVGLGLMAKRFEFLKEAVPGLSRVAVLWDQGQDAPGFKRAIGQGAAAVGVNVIWIDFTEEIDQMFGVAMRERAEALFTGGGARLLRNRKKIVELAARHRLPDTHYTGEFVEAGGLMSYAPNLPDLFRRGAKYVDKILRGANPADLPVEQPTKIDLIINLRTARALGIKISPSLLLRADRVIE